MAKYAVVISFETDDLEYAIQYRTEIERRLPTDSHDLPTVKLHRNMQVLSDAIPEKDPLDGKAGCDVCGWTSSSTQPHKITCRGVARPLGAQS